MTAPAGPGPGFRLPGPVRFMLIHGLVGFGLAGLFTAALWWADPGGVATVLRRAPGHPWPLVLLWFFCGLTFGGVKISVAAMMLEARHAHQDRE